MLVLFNGAWILLMVILTVGFFLLYVFTGTTTVNGRQILPPFGLKAPSGWVTALLFLVWIGLAIAIPCLYANRRLKNTRRLLTEKCDPPQFIAVMNRLLRRYRSGGLWVGLMLDLCTGYLNLRDLAAARQILADIRFFPDNRTGSLDRIAYYHCCFLVSYYEGDRKSAEWSLGCLKNAVDYARIREKERRRSGLLYENDVFLFNLKSGYCEDAGRVLNERFRNARTELEKVATQLTLGEVCRKEGREDEARAAFTYAAEHGNRLYFAGQARRALEKEPVA